MDDNAKALVHAREVLNDLCKALDSEDWRYEKDAENLKISFKARGEDLPMHFAIFIDPNPGYIRLFSYMPFEIRKDKLVDTAIAVCAVNYLLKSGTFDFDINDGSLSFRITQMYFDSTIGEDVLKYMIFMAAHVVDEYNDKFMALSTGNIDLDAFMQKINS